MSALDSFNIDEFIKFNFDNSTHSLKLLRGQGYWVHFEVLANFYDDLGDKNDPQLSSSHLRMAWMHFVSGCKLNLIKGVSNALSGHLSDSSIYVRRTIESVRYSSFLRDQPEVAELWFRPDGKEEFEKKYSKWWDKLGRALVDSEMEGSNFQFKHASNYGPHSNAQLFGHLNDVEYGAGTMNVRTNYHEIEPNEQGYHSLLTLFFWHMRIHAQCIEWWMRKSKFVTHLTADQHRYWSDCWGKLKADNHLAIEMVKSGPLVRSSEQPKFRR